MKVENILGNSVVVVGTRGYPSYYGGFETAARYIAPYLADENWDVTVYGRKNSTKPSDPKRDYRVGTVETGGLETKSLSTLTYGFTAVLDAVRRKPSVALVMNVANGFWLPLLKLRGIPTVVNVDGIEWEREKWGRLAKFIFKAGARMTARYATVLVSDSLEIKRRWKEDWNRDSEYIAYGGEDPGFLAVPDGLEHRGYVLLVARFVPENTIGPFLDAARIIAEKYPVVIVGSSGYGGIFDDQARELDESHEKVRWLGHVSDDLKLHALWQHAGVYFHGHSVGGTNPALVQAMMCGAPILARDTTYNREVLEDTGRFTGPEAVTIQEQCMALMKNERLRDTIGAAAMERAKALYSWPGVCRKYRDVLAGAIQS